MADDDALAGVRSQADDAAPDGWIVVAEQIDGGTVKRYYCPPGSWKYFPGPTLDLDVLRSTPVNDDSVGFEIIDPEG